MRDCRLECVQAVIERQKRMPAEANDDRLFLDRQHRRSRFLWSRPSVHDRAARLPLAHRLLIDAVTSGERSQALFTMLYRSTDRLSRRGAPVKNLAHSASFDSCHKNAPSKCGTKQLVPILVIWFGAGTVLAVATAFMLSFFPVIVNVATGFATIEPELLDVLRSLGASRWDMVVKIGMPRALPYFFASLKIAITLSFVGTVIAEIVACNNGIGNV